MIICQQQQRVIKKFYLSVDVVTVRLYPALNMSFSLSGKQFPELVVPSRLPKSSSEKIVLLVVRGLLGSGIEIRLAQRLLTTILSRVGNEAVGCRLNGLVSAGFLVKVHSGSGGTVYGKGKRLASRTRLGDETARLAKFLFGEGGLCSGLLERSAFGHGFLNHSGLIIVGVLRRCPSAVSVGELKRYLKLLLSPTRINSAIKKLKSCGVVAVTSEGVSLAPDWEMLLHKYEVESGANDRVSACDKKFETQRDKYSAHLGRLKSDDYKYLVSAPCVACGRPAGKGQQKEHFPPKVYLRRDLGFSKFDLDHWSVVSSICKECNDFYGAWVTKNRSLPLPSFPDPEVSLRGESLDEDKRVLKLVLERRQQRFYRAVRLGDDSAALFAVAVAVDAWRSFVDEYPQLAPVAGLVKILPGGRKLKGARPIDGARFRSTAWPRGRLVRRLRVG